MAMVMIQTRFNSTSDLLSTLSCLFVCCCINALYRSVVILGLKQSKVFIFGPFFCLFSPLFCKKLIYSLIPTAVWIDKYMAGVSDKRCHLFLVRPYEAFPEHSLQIRCVSVTGCLQLVVTKTSSQLCTFCLCVSSFFFFSDQISN